jgi:enoyl-[acyl-carrier protein] reductase I
MSPKEFRTRLMTGRKGLVIGVANRRSLAWGIASRLRDEGAIVAFSYYGQSGRNRVKSLLPENETAFLYECDVGLEDSIVSMLEQVRTDLGEIDFLVHSVANAPKETLRNRFIDISAESFQRSMNVSCYSLTAICRHAAPLMSEGASILTLSYFGSQRVIPNYNLMGVAKAALEASVHYLAVDLGAMGIRINTISAGPIKTISAVGVDDFRQIIKWCERNSPLRRNVTIEDVGGTGVFLLSDLAQGITGETIYVDSGYHLVGMRLVDAVPIDTTEEDVLNSSEPRFRDRFG